MTSKAYFNHNFRSCRQIFLYPATCNKSTVRLKCAVESSGTPPPPARLCCDFHATLPHSSTQHRYDFVATDVRPEFFRRGPGKGLSAPPVMSIPDKKMRLDPFMFYLRTNFAVDRYSMLMRVYMQFVRRVNGK